MTSMHFYESEGDFDAADDRQLYPPPPNKKEEEREKLKKKLLMFILLPLHIWYLKGLAVFLLLYHRPVRVSRC